MRTTGYITSRSGKRLEKIDKEILFEHGKYVENEMINIFPELHYQKVIGFGVHLQKPPPIIIQKWMTRRKRRSSKLFLIKKKDWVIISAEHTFIPVTFL